MLVHVLSFSVNGIKIYLCYVQCLSVCESILNVQSAKVLISLGTVCVGQAKWSEHFQLKKKNKKHFISQILVFEWNRSHLIHLYQLKWLHCVITSQMDYKHCEQSKHNRCVHIIRFTSCHFTVCTVILPCCFQLLLFVWCFVWVIHAIVSFIQSLIYEKFTVKIYISCSFSAVICQLNDAYLSE